MKRIIQISLFLLISHILVGQQQPSLHVAENGTVLFGQDTTTMDGIKFLWQPSKASLRAGRMTPAWGYNFIGNFSVGFGSDTEAIGNFSMATGLGTRSHSFAEVSLGRYSLRGGSVTVWSLNDPIFEIGNGATSGSESNMLTVQKNGNMKIGTMTDATEIIRERLVLDGAIVVGNSFAATPQNGTIRYNGSDLQGLVGGSWQSLVNSGSSSVWSLSGSNTYYVNGNVGIGTVAPNSQLHVNIPSGSTNPAIRVQVNGSSKFLVNPNGGVSIGQNTTSSPANGLFVAGSVVMGNSATTTAAGFRLSVDGKIIAEELQVELSSSWPDYVFAENYNLLPISELTSFINEHQHLPGIPSAATLESEGLAVGEMQTKMMEKIEELTLYIIELHEKIETLEKGQK